MKLYQEMFGEDFDLGFNVDNFPFLTDKSYRNDICPSFYFKAANCYYILWVDYSSPDQRENESNSRYTIVEAVNAGDDEHHEIESNHDSSFLVEFERSDELANHLKVMSN